MLCAGCGSGSSVPTYGSITAIGTFYFQTSQLTAAGASSTEAWGNTVISGLDKNW
jgi:hypothetical protein